MGDGGPEAVLRRRVQLGDYLTGLDCVLDS